jgi:ubiquinone/menaquinone biosynthesis C-methylase UbiE
VHEYDQIAQWHASERVDQTGVPEATTLASSIPRGSLVLDVGCGNGMPISRALLNGGHRVIGLDSSGAMLEHFRRNCPEAFAVKGIVQSCPFADHSYRSILGDHGFTLANVHADSGNNTYYLAKKAEPPS